MTPRLISLWIVWMFLVAPGTAIAALQEDVTAIRTILLEARGEGLNGMIAVGEVIRNRAKARHQTFSEVCLAPLQFSAWNAPRAAKHALAGISGEEYQRAAKAWALSEHTNLVNGATHYHTVSVYPYWAIGHTPIRIGSHLFYRGIK